jgi:hypothetical protein
MQLTYDGLNAMCGSRLCVLQALRQRSMLSLPLSSPRSLTAHDDQEAYHILPLSAASEAVSSARMAYDQTRLQPGCLEA